MALEILAVVRGQQDVCTSIASALPHNLLQPYGHLPAYAPFSLAALLPAFTFLIPVPWSQERESNCCSQRFTYSYVFGIFTAGNYCCFTLIK